MDFKSNDSIIDSLICRRLNKDEQQYASYHRLIAKEVIGNCSIVYREGKPNLFGLVDESGHILVPIIFDCIQSIQMGKGLAISLSDRGTGRVLQSLYSLKHREIVYQCDLHEVVSDDISNAIVVVKDGRKGLYDIDLNKEIAKMEYDDIQTNINSYYIWAFKEGLWEFINTKNGRKTVAGNILAALDNEHYRCILRKCESSDYATEIACIDDNGLNDALALRRIAIEQNSAGRIRLYNRNQHIEVVANVYGNVLFCNKKLNQYD